MATSRSFFIALATFAVVLCQRLGSQPYYGVRIGTMRNNARGVGGDVYAVDDNSVFIKGFRYDGTGQDAHFWVGMGPQPSAQGTLVPNELGRDDALQKYDNRDILIKLPMGKRLTDITWFSVWSRQEQQSYGDVFLPPGMKIPRSQTISRLSGGSGNGGVRSNELVIEDAKTIRIPGFNYDGTLPETYFVAGTGSVPSSQGTKLPDERGAIQNLRTYRNEDVKITLPHEFSVTDIEWIGIWNYVSNQNLGYATIPKDLSIPPSPMVVGGQYGGQFSSGSQYGQQGGQYGSQGGQYGSQGGQYGSGTGQYGSGSGQYGSQGGQYGSGSGQYGSGSGQYGSGSGQYGSGSGQYGSGTGQYGSGTGQYGSQGGQYGSGTGQYGSQGGQYGSQGGQYGSQGGQYGSQGGQYGSQGGQYGSGTGQYGQQGGQYDTGYGGQGSFQTQFSSAIDTFTNCEEYMNGKVQVSWKLMGDRVRIRLAGQINDNEWMAFGVSGSPTGSSMINGDVAVVYQEGARTNVVDYALDSKSRCTGTTGACPDVTLGGQADLENVNTIRNNGITIVTYERKVNTNDRYDKPILTYGDTYVIAAVGPLTNNEINLHTQKTTDNPRINFSQEGQRNCRNQLSNMVSQSGGGGGGGQYGGSGYSTGGYGSQGGYGGGSYGGGGYGVTSYGGQYGQSGYGSGPFNNNAWYIQPINMEPEIRCQIGPTGGDRGYAAITGKQSSGQAWWCNNRLAPEIVVERGRTYNFVIEGGDDQANSAKYNPFYITSSDIGGYGLLNANERDKERIFAGVERDYRGNPNPTWVGRYCEWRPRTYDMNANSFDEYKNNLEMTCDDGVPQKRAWTPDDATPDVVYYQSYSHRNFGHKFRVQGHAGFVLPSTASNVASPVMLVFILFLSTLVFLRG